MGAFVLANYLARSGNGCHFDGAIAISGALDMRQQLNFYRSMRLWQPILAQGLRDMALGKFLPLYREKLTREQYLSVLRAPHVLVRMHTSWKGENV